MPSDGDPNGVAQAVAALRQAYETGVACPPLRERLLPAGDLEAAYEVQGAMVAQWQAAGRRPVGAKIGLTSEAVQRQLGVDQPDCGVLLADMAVPDGGELAFTALRSAPSTASPRPTAPLLQPKVEAEVAFVLGADLTAEQVTIVDVIRAVDHLLPAIEIADSRIAGWNISIVDTVADNASSGRYVLGTRPARLADVDLRLCGMVLAHAGEPVSVGAGAACLGNPLHALAWLAQHLARAGTPLRAGDLVLSGALGPMVTAEPGAAYEARISGLGSVRVRFAAEEES